MIDFAPIPDPGPPTLVEPADSNPELGAAFAEMLQRSLGKNPVGPFVTTTDDGAVAADAGGSDGESVVPEDAETLSGEASPAAPPSMPAPPSPQGRAPTLTLSPEVTVPAELIVPAGAQIAEPATAPESAGLPMAVSASRVGDTPTVSPAGPAVPPPVSPSDETGSVGTGASGYVAAGEITTSTPLEVSPAAPLRGWVEIPVETNPTNSPTHSTPTEQVKVDQIRPTAPGQPLDPAGAGATAPSLESSAVALSESGNEAVVGTTGVLGEQPLTTSAPRPAFGPTAAAAIDRVVRIAELRESMPPPQRVVVEMPEFELRLAVTVRGNIVHVAGATEDAVPVAFRPLVPFLDTALAARGYTLDAGGGRREEAAGESPHGRSQPEPPRWGRQRRPGPSRGLLI